MLPGYLDGNVPYGICSYVPDETQRSWINNISRKMSMSFSISNHEEQPITGVYSMGSTSSIGQNIHSDLDIWVCYQSWLDTEERTQLQHKCHLLEQWAICQGVDVNFFLINEHYFRHHNKNMLKDEFYGSTHHMLLLDEFYRTAVRLGGKRILWNIVPGKEEANYDEYVLSLYTCGALIPNEWLNLGGLGGTLSIEEYFESSLYHLYQSTISPYKAVLKTLLLEAYSWEYPHTKFLSINIKQHLHDGEIVSFGLDPYCMMLERITYYLIQINDTTRLDIVRCCFYLKIRETLSQSVNNILWRREILIQLVKNWGWNEERLIMLDNLANLKVGKIRQTHNEILDIMMNSYNNLIQFAHRNNLSIQAILKILAR